MQTEKAHDLTRRSIGMLGKMVSLWVTAFGRISWFYILIRRSLRIRRSNRLRQFFGTATSTHNTTKDREKYHDETLWHLAVNASGVPPRDIERLPEWPKSRCFRPGKPVRRANENEVVGLLL